MFCNTSTKNRSQDSSTNRAGRGKRRSQAELKQKQVFSGLCFSLVLGGAVNSSETVPPAPKCQHILQPPHTDTLQGYMKPSPPHKGIPLFRLLSCQIRDVVGSG